MVYLLFGLTKPSDGHFVEKFFILVKCPHASRKKSDWFRCKKISQKLKYLNFKCEQSEKYFFILFYSFTTLRIFHAKNFAGDRRKALEEIRLNQTFLLHEIKIVHPFYHNDQIDNTE